MRLNPPTDDANHCVSIPYNPVNLRPRISTIGSAELVSALGFNALEALNLLRFRSSIDGDKETLEAIWMLAQEIQAQLTEQELWHDDAVRCAPIVLKTLGEFFTHPP